jgi:hypothetical protein
MSLGAAFLRADISRTCVLTLQELKPLEVALESVDGMTRKLTAVITARPLDIKMLQLRLQV